MGGGDSAISPLNGEDGAGQFFPPDDDELSSEAGSLLVTGKGAVGLNGKINAQIRRRNICPAPPPPRAVRATPIERGNGADQK